MGKIIPISRAREKMLDKYSPVKDNPVRFSSISLILAIIAIIIEIYIIGKYHGKDDYANYSILLLILGIFGFTGAFMLNKEGIFVLNDYYLKSVNGALKFITSVVGLLLAMGFLMLTLRATFRFALEAIDLYLYYLAAAVIEELFFRFFLISLVMRVRIQLLPPVISKGISAILALFISSTIFMIAHWEVYGHSGELMTAMFIGGIIFGLFFIIMKDITINMVAHLIINLLNVGTLLVMMGS